ncbi:MAG TPA: hypothetical protein VFI37_14630 [Gaiellaceae bacterium]|jgi:hypothetical protein|nr:hypothetical protein [Gaiellaceae bacterium]
MRLFRSEEDVRLAYPEPGAIFPVERLWPLAAEWYGGRLEPGWQPRTQAESQAVLARHGFTGAFWRLP